MIPARRRNAALDSVSSVATRDTVLLGFGLEQTPEARALAARALNHLLD